MPETSLCAIIGKIHGQTALALVNKLEMINKELEIQREDDVICIPLFRNPDEKELLMLKAQIPNLQFSTCLFAKKSRHRKTLAEAVRNQLPLNLIPSLPRAIDIIGDIAIVETSPELKAYEKLIGEAILDSHKNVQTVLAKMGAVTGTYRLRELRVIAGKNKTETMHNEQGCRFKIDVTGAYFSPRLSQEHKRVAALVQKDETIVDMFAGVGPFSILLAKNKVGVKVYAIDMNPKAIELLNTNIRLNRVEDRVFPIHGDARQVIEVKLQGVADRVIMNLPEKASEFVDVACKALKFTGGTVHYYGFFRLPDSLENQKLLLAQAVERNGRKLERIILAKTIRETAPYEWQFVIDARIL